uniref:CCHC-type domain-containing protein n=1 Tax=Fagus sylvatica TaxID=28930 RepID=A0A2N9IFC0_FAGSY
MDCEFSEAGDFPTGSYKDRLVGEIPGAFLHAFGLDPSSTVLGEIEEEEDEILEDVQEVIDGIANVKLSKNTKVRIRSKWTHSLIIKVFGRSVGFHFLHSRIMGLWKPAGRLDCVDLGHEFFLIRFGLVEDFDRVLQNGPWFIGEHYLTIRPWQPNFKPSTANCSSVAVWARLPELPIEYYEESVLRSIGSAIGPVLKIDAQTATESRGRYARICVQVNLDNPLIRAVRLDKFYQSVIYEGLHLLCFSCGRLGHRKGNCPYSIKEPTQAPVEEVVVLEVDKDDELAGNIENDYGPWSIVQRPTAQDLPVTISLQTRKNVCQPITPNFSFVSTAVTTPKLETQHLPKSFSSPRVSDSLNGKRSSSLPKEKQKNTEMASSSQQVWGILLRGKIMEVPPMMLDHIRATPTATLGWYDQELMTAWKYIFPLTKESRVLGLLPFFRSGVATVGKPLVGVLDGPTSTKTGEYTSVEDATVNISGASLVRIKSLRRRSQKGEFFLICQREMSMGIMEHTVTMMKGDGATKRFLKEMGWSLMEQMRSLPQIDECPTPNLSLIMNIILWNCRGALNPNFRRSIADLVSCHSPSLLIVTETRVGGDRAKEITDTLPFDGAIHADTIGYAGGLWLLWNSAVVDVSVLAATEQEIHAVVKVRSSNFSWLLSAIYASPRFLERKVLWDNLSQVASLHNLPWLLAGDFNEVLSSEDKFGGLPVNLRRSQLFSNCLNNCGMMDLGFHGPRFTCRSGSLILPSQRLSNNSWDVVLPLESNIIEFTEAVMKWNKDVFGNIFWKKKNLTARLRGIQSSLAEEEFWSVKSRYNWLIQGDRNTAFFHSSTLVRRKRNRILSIKDNMVLQEVYGVSTTGKLVSSEGDSLTLSQPISSSEVKVVLWSMKPFKAPGPDGLHAGKFRPIGLCNTIYKVVTKIIVLRLRPLLDALISPLQTAFVPGRKGIDNMIIVQELVHSLSLKKGLAGFVAIKIDLEKAYDRIEWQFIRDMLNLFKVPNFLSNVIMSCVSTSSISVLLNGGKLESFLPSRAARNGPAFSHLFFADDLVLFAKADRKNCQSIKEVLETFCDLSGQKVNSCKSKAYFSPNVNPDQRRELCSVLGIDSTPNLGKYLGFPIKHSGSSGHDFDFIIDRMQTKLTGWKAKLLSMAGRVILTQAVTSAIPSYVMQGIMLPAKILNSIDRVNDRVNRNFIWGSSDLNKKLHLVSWRKITRPKSEGGLGIMAAKPKNLALAAKLCWRFKSKPNAFWAKVLGCKYLFGARPRKHAFSKTWSTIRKGEDICTLGSRWLIGSNCTLNFWSDKWLKWLTSGDLRGLIFGPLNLGEELLCINNIYEDDGILAWHLHRLSFVIPYHLELLIKATPIRRNSVGGNELIWNSTSDGNFNSKDAYLLALGSNAENSVFSHNWIWKLNILPKIQLMLWKCAHLSLPVRNVLVRRKIILDPLCEICQESEETILHVFRDCHVAHSFWLDAGLSPSNSFFLGSNCMDWGLMLAYLLQTPFSLAQIAWIGLMPMLVINPRSLASSLLGISSFFLAFGTYGYNVIRSPILMPIRWEKPSPGWVKLNTDGSSLVNLGIAGSGGLIRNSDGDWIMGFVRNIGTTGSVGSRVMGFKRWSFSMCSTTAASCRDRIRC